MAYPFFILQKQNKVLKLYEKVSLYYCSLSWSKWNGSI